MSDQEWEERVVTLERRLWWRTLGFAVALVVVVIALYPREPPPPPRLTSVDIPGTKLMSGELLMMDSSQTGGRSAENVAALTLSPVQASLGMSAGSSGFDVDVSDRTPTVTIKVDGAVRSTITIDTSTGTWALSRARQESKGRYGPEQVQTLVPPLP